MGRERKVVWVKYHDKYRRWKLECIGFFVLETEKELCIAKKRHIENKRIAKEYYGDIVPIPKTDIIAYKSITELEAKINE